MVNEEEKKKDDDNDEEMEDKRRDEKDVQEILVVERGMLVKFLFVLFATFVLSLDFPLQGSFHQ